MVGSNGNNLVFLTTGAEKARIDSAGRLNINNTSATTNLSRTYIFGADTDSNGLQVAMSTSSVGPTTSRAILVNGGQPNQNSQYYGIQVSPTQSYVTSMTGIDVTFASSYGTTYGLSINLNKNLDASTSGYGIYANVVSTGTTNNGSIFAGDFKISQTGGASTAGQWVARFQNAATSGATNFVTFGTEASYTERGSITYNRTSGVTVYSTTSDYRAKDIIGAVTDSGSLIDSVPVYMGKMHGASLERPMFIAHETPAYAHTGEKDEIDKDGNPVYQQMDASTLIPVMWAEIQSLRARLKSANL
jgi:hypothetical protein